jgi:hypothetical protein
MQLNLPQSTLGPVNAIDANRCFLQARNFTTCRMPDIQTKLVVLCATCVMIITSVNQAHVELMRVRNSCVSKLDIQHYSLEFVYLRSKLKYWS